MSFDSDNHSAKCPFYHRSDPTKIYCEGVDESSSVVNMFRDKASCKAHKKKCCFSLAYGKCPLALGLNIHYESN